MGLQTAARDIDRTRAQIDRAEVDTKEAKLVDESRHFGLSVAAIDTDGSSSNLSRSPTALSRWSFQLLREIRAGRGSCVEKLHAYGRLVAPQSA